MPRYEHHVDPTPDFERKIDIIIERVPQCEKHPALSSERDPGPCFELPIDSKLNADRSHNWGVCNWRARQAGFRGDNLDSTPRPRVLAKISKEK